MRVPAGEGKAGLFAADFGTVKSIERPRRESLSTKTPRERIIFYYNEMIDKLRHCGLLHRLYYTPHEFGEHLHTKGKSNAEAVRAIVTHFHRAKYSPIEIDETAAASAQKAAKYICDEAADRAKLRREQRNT